MIPLQMFTCKSSQRDYTGIVFQCNDYVYRSMFLLRKDDVISWKHNNWKKKQKTTTWYCDFAKQSLTFIEDDMTHELSPLKNRYSHWRGYIERWGEEHTAVVKSHGREVWQRVGGCSLARVRLLRDSVKLFAVACGSLVRPRRPRPCLSASSHARHSPAAVEKHSLGGGGLITVSVNEKRLETHKVVLMLHLFPNSSSCR